MMSSQDTDHNNSVELCVPLFKIAKRLSLCSSIRKWPTAFFSLLPLLFLRLIPVTITAVLPLPAVIPSTTIPSTAIAIATYYYCVWLSRWLSGKESACHAGDAGAVPGLGRSPGEGNGNPLHYSCLGNPMDRGGWWATVHVVSRVGHDLVTKQQQQQ